MKTTKFEITMIVDVVDVGDVQASSGALHTSAIKAIEGISTGDVVKVIEAHTSQLTFPNGISLKFKDATKIPVITAKKLDHKLNS